jgi:hypothetical protein
MRRFGALGSSILVATLFACVGACSKDDPPPNDCPAAGAAFIVTISTSSEPLPGDTLVRVHFGGGQDEYRLDRPPSPTVLFCDPLRDAGGATDAGSPVHALRCALWTEGSATLEVRASGYAPHTETLAAKAAPEECGLAFVTQKVEVELEPADGGK